MTKRVVAFAATFALFALYVILIVSGQREPGANRRHVTLLHVASLTSARSANVTNDGTALRLDASAADASASWDSYSYQIPHLVRQADYCKVSVAIVGLDLTSSSAAGTADILVNGTSIKHIRFSNANRAFYPLTTARFVPGNVIPRLVELVPLDRRYGFVSDLPTIYCSAETLRIGVRLHGSFWKISHIGAVVDYVPAPLPKPSGVLYTVTASALVASAFVCVFLVLYSMTRLGTPALVATIIVLVISPLTYDQWDFRIWINFGEFATFGRSDPAYLWFGSPLWTFVPGIFSSLTAASFFLTGHGGESMSYLSLKIGLGIAYCYCAYEIAARAPLRFRSYFALAGLLLPGSLFELTGGYREIFATALVLASIRALRHTKFLIGTLLIVFAASIGEENLPLIFLPAAILLATSRRSRATITKAIVFALTGFFYLWLNGGSSCRTTSPSQHSATVLAPRLSEARFGPAPSAVWGTFRPGFRFNRPPSALYRSSCFRYYRASFS